MQGTLIVAQAQVGTNMATAPHHTYSIGLAAHLVFLAVFMAASWAVFAFQVPQRTRLTILKVIEIPVCLVLLFGGIFTGLAAASCNVYGRLFLMIVYCLSGALSFYLGHVIDKDSEALGEDRSGYINLRSGWGFGFYGLLSCYFGLAVLFGW
jgi:hypothetical protein